MNKWIQVGFLMRGQVRAELVKNGISFTETKVGWGTSIFTLDCSEADWIRVRAWIRANNG